MQDAQPNPPFQIASRDDEILAQLARLRDTLVEKAEELALCLEHQMNPGVAAALEGREQSKARHLYVTQAKRLDSDLNRILAQAQGFRVHIY